MSNSCLVRKKKKRKQKIASHRAHQIPWDEQLHIALQQKQLFTKTWQRRHIQTTHFTFTRFRDKAWRSPWIDGIWSLHILPFLVCETIQIAYFLIWRNSKLRRGSSRVPLETGAREKEGGLCSMPGWILWVVEARPVLEITLLLFRTSVESPDEFGLPLEIAALLDELQFLEVRPLSESGCCNLMNHRNPF